MTYPAVHFRGVRKRYRRQTVLDGVDLEVRRGERFALVGVNGAGKTTLLRALLDLSRADAGSIRIQGADSREPRARRPLTFLPERFQPPYYLRGREFLRSLCRLQDLPYDRARAEAILASLDFPGEALGRVARTYSKGMAQKLGLAGALLTGRDLLVLDEPMSGLDPKARALLKAQLLGLGGGGRTLLFTSHLLGDVEALAERMGILHGGRLVFVGTPAECRERFGAADLEGAFLAAIGTASAAA
jgi:ABC-2 type transport system ATP-binding protein